MGVIGGDGGDIRMYDKDDKNRPNNIGRNVSGRVSIEWMAADVIKGQNIPLERRDLSDRILAYSANDQLV